MANDKQVPLDEVMSQIKDRGFRKVRLAICDIDGILRGKVVSLDKFQSIANSGFGFCDVVFGWDAADEAYDNTKYTGWHNGYPDAPAVIDTATLRFIPWLQGLPMFIADLGGAAVCPRSLLKEVRNQCLEAGYKPMLSQEFEWFNFQETPQRLEAKQFTNIQPMTAGMFGYSVLRSTEKSAYFQEIFDAMPAFEVPLEGLHTETGPGVYEAAILYSEVLEAADRAALFKTGVKEIAYSHELMASFMAKWNVDYPGCSGHIHQSLWDDKHNLFYDEQGDHQMSTIMQQYVAGQLHCLPHILPMYAPTINSYKRLVEGAWAPTTLTWGIDNRTTALRALPGSEKSTRLETRVPGSDVNPYLAMSAALASGLYGIKHKLELQAPTSGNGYKDLSHGILPHSLESATEAMDQSSLARELFGEEFVDHFVASRKWECRQFAPAVTDWELKRYFEII
jgi:glutamine synthetase